MNGKKVLMEIDLPLPRANKDTKIREMYDTGKFAKETLLMVATDRVSVKDTVLLSGIPGKGEVLTKISANWFRQTEQICPNHFITEHFEHLPVELQEVLKPYKSMLSGRFMLVQKAKPILLECIVRDSPLGSGWNSYEKTGKICGIKLPKGLKKGEKLPAPIFTPSTKAKAGEHDENISFEQAVKIVGLKTAQTLQAYSLSIYSYIATTASLKHIKIPDTKFEFGFELGYDDIENITRIIQTDEIGTPDSSRFEPDYSKEPLRQWLESVGWDGETPTELPKEVIAKTSQRYIKGCEILTGHTVIPQNNES